jgi:hypothetical protein
MTRISFREETPDLAGPQVQPLTRLLHAVTMNNEYIEDTWQAHAKNLIDDTNPIDSVKTFLLFRRLFKVRMHVKIFGMIELLVGNPTTIGGLCQ